MLEGNVSEVILDSQTAFVIVNLVPGVDIYILQSILLQVRPSLMPPDWVSESGIETIIRTT